MNNVMLDIETLGTAMNSVVIQIAAVRFDENGNIGDSICINLNRDEQLAAGLVKEDSTIDWWNNTNPELFKRLLTENIIPVKEALEKFNSFININDRIWSHATFDIPVLTSLFKAFNIKPNWYYVNHRDIRTLVSLAHVNLKAYNWKSEKTHDAFDDCKFQIKYCTDGLKYLQNLFDKEDESI